MPRGPVGRGWNPFRPRRDLSNRQSSPTASNRTSQEPQQHGSGLSEQARRVDESRVAPNGTILSKPDLRWYGARTACGWSGTASFQLNELRRQGLGVEPTWLAVLHRIRHRDEDGYHRWCSGYLRELRSQFGRELNSHLHTRRLTMQEIDWASRVEQAAYQDFLHYVRGLRTPVTCIPHLGTDAQILATSTMATRGIHRGSSMQTGSMVRRASGVNGGQRMRAS